jgi:outer membrane protein OmpA-like peptidoglycan-associated protein
MPISMPSIRQAILLTIVLLMVWGCGTRVGPVTDNGTYLDLNGEAVNAYADPLPDTVEAALQTLAFLELPIGSRRVADNEVVITATAPDGAPLRLHFIKEGRALTMVKIRTGALGYWRRELSYYLHTLIGERLKRTEHGVGKVAPDKPASRAAGRAVPEKAAPLPSKSPGTSFGTRNDRATKAIPVVPNDATSPKKAHKPLLPSPAPPPEPLVQPDASIYFEPDSNFPKADELAKLERLARQLLANPSWRLSIIGYAENGENEGQSQMVAENRVLAVEFYFVGKGVDSHRLIDLGSNKGGPKVKSSVLEQHRVDLLLQRLP